MTDLADAANVLIEFQQGVSRYKSVRDVPPSESTGVCWFCEEYLPVGHRWCDAKCRDDWEKDNGNA